MTDFRRYIHDVPDFPSPGILFRDVTPLLASPSAFADAAKAMAEPFRADPPSKVLGIEARGFLFGAALARELHVGIEKDFRPAQKAHPAFVVDIDATATKLLAAGFEVVWADADEIPGRRRFHSSDGVGNRVEFLDR